MSKKYEDYSKLRRISINDKFQMHCSEDKLTFSGSDFPKGVNLTLSYTPKNPVINLHFTRQTSANDKPQIRVCEIAKKELDKLDVYFVLNLYSSIFVKLDTADSQYDKAGFLSFSKMFQGRNELRLKSFYRRLLAGISKLRKTRLKIKGEIEEVVSVSLEKSDFSKFFENQIVSFRDTDLSSHIDGGFLCLEDKTIPVIRINNTWFRFKENFNPEELFLSIMPQELYSQLKNRYDFALSKIQELNTWDESRPFQAGMMRLYIDGDYEVIDNDFTKAFEELIDTLRKEANQNQETQK